MTTIDPLFEAAYTALMERYIKNSKGERKRKLQKGLEHAQRLFLQNVWWPAFGNFHNLSPEFEIRDFKDGWRYLDFAWLIGSCKVAIEINGYGPHWRSIDRWKFSDNLNRQNHLVLDDWKVLRFSYDEINEHPKRCQQLLLQAIGKWGGLKSVPSAITSPVDRAIINYSEKINQPFTAAYAAAVLGWSKPTIARHLKKLVQQGILLPSIPDRRRNHSYIYNPNQSR